MTGSGQARGDSSSKGTERHLALFDFDGTITSRDSLFDFIRSTFGMARLIVGLSKLAPRLILALAGVRPRWQGKEAVLAYFFGGWETSEFASVAERYARERIPRLIRKDAARCIEWHRREGHRLVVVSASPEAWIRPWCEAQGMEAIATRLEEREGRLTGRIAGRNCQGEEKVRRVREIIDLDSYTRIYAYGNSRGDMPMLSLAHERYLNWKRII